MKSLKHIGRIKNTGSKVLVVFRTLPGESDHSLVLPVSSLSNENHDSIMKLVETPQAQDVFEFGEIMFIRTFPDGKPMLQSCRAENILQKIPTDRIIMTPNTRDEILLSDLNILIAEQRNCAVDDLCKFVSGFKQEDTIVEDIAQVKDLGRDVGEPNIPPTPLKASNTEALSDRDIAKSYRSQADAMYKEAARLRKQADELDPPQKKTVKSKETADA